MKAVAKMETFEWSLKKLLQICNKFTETEHTNGSKTEGQTADKLGGNILKMSLSYISHMVPVH